MEHLYFFLLNFVVFLLIVLVDRKRWRDYLLLAILALAMGFVFENATTLMGFWHYHSEPKVLFVSFYSWLLYMPYLGFCYFASKKVMEHV